MTEPSERIERDGLVLVKLRERPASLTALPGGRGHQELTVNGHRCVVDTFVNLDVRPPMLVRRVVNMATGDLSWWNDETPRPS